MKATEATPFKFQSSRMREQRVIYDASQSRSRFAREARQPKERRYLANWEQAERGRR